MNAPKWTPGRWVARPDPHGSPNDACIGLDDDDSPVDYIAVCHNRDANLIAAAPELLEALNRLTSFVVTEVVESCNGNKCRELWCEGCFGEETAERTVNEARDALTNARAVIEKATGGDA